MQTQAQQKISENSLYNPQEEHDACGVGFIGNISNKAEHRIIEYTLSAMSRLTHRGGQEEDKKMSDGSGVLVPIAKEFFGKIFPEITDPSVAWGIGSFFLPYDSFLHDALFEGVERVAKRLSFKIATNREVPTDINVVSRKVLATLPEFRQILFISEDSADNANTIEQRLYVLRKQMEFEAISILNKYNVDLSAFHVASLSSKSIVYKGILPGKNLGKFYLDLADPNFAVPFAIFHERFSTNTKPSWHMTQPFRNIAHNGEINTIRGNTTQMGIREAALSSEKLGENLSQVLPCIHASTSDSGSFDNVYELLLQGGYDVGHATATMIPEPIFEVSESTKNTQASSSALIDAKKNAFYAYHTSLMEPWDGPTTMVFTDGYSKVGASLDRNGLRPCRYSITKDNIIILSSEVGVLDLDQSEYIEQGQLAPRTLLIVDFENQRVLHDKEIKEKLFNQANYEEILKEKRIQFTQKNCQNIEIEEENSAFFDLFGFGEKAPEAMIMAMINTKEEPVGAMGLDEPLAVLSHKSQTLFNYFKQLFAQVTNPSIDPIREKFSMSLATNLGGKSNLFQKPEEQAPYFALQTPFLFGEIMEQVRSNGQIKTQTLSITMPLHAGFDGFNSTLTGLCLAAEKAVYDGTRVLVLSDKDLTKDKMPLPVLLAVAAVNQALIRKNLRHACDIVIETGQAFEVMHMALLLSFGANAVYPYAAFASIGKYLQNKKSKEGYSFEEGIGRYCQALEKGLLKVFARLGVSALSSFIGSRSFECVGLHKDVIDTFFTNTLSRIGGISLENIYQENYDRFLSFVVNTHESSKTDKHIWTRELCSTLRKSVIENDYNFFGMYSKQLAKQEADITLRSVWKFAPTTAINIDDVESVEAIQKRFYSAAMSLGALSKDSHECIALAFNNLGLSSNCGEGGEEVRRSQSRGSDVDLCSRIRQIASGRFGVTAEYLASGDEVQIKIAQGAKPGEGGQLPAHKVTPYIAEVRHTKENVSLISPPPHHDIYSIEDLAQLIFDIKKLKKGIKVSVKLVAQAGIGTVAVGVVKAGADSICVSGHDGGTGAAPLSSIYHVGLPWELGLAEVHQALIANSMRYKITLQTDGQIQSGKDIVTAFMLGADEVSFGTSLLVSMGCILCRQCYKGLCPVGICTQNPDLVAKFSGKAQHIEHYLTFLAKEVREHLAMLGLRSVDELIGRADLFQVNYNSLPEKAQNIDMSALFQCLPYTKREAHSYRGIEMDEWEEELLVKAKEAIGAKKGFIHAQKVKNTDRAIGANVAGAMALSYQEFEDNFITLACIGAAGQSFGAFAPKGLRLTLEGNANDYVGKGLCGGIISIRPTSKTDVNFEKQAIMGNVVLYGATEGKLFVSGRAGERFAVRNSGAIAVVEGVGEHGCEYMTGGTVAILGSCGYNFAAGMTGGVIYMYATKESLASKINPINVGIFELDEADNSTLQGLLEEHVAQTQSKKATAILAAFESEVKNFVKVMYSAHV